MLITPIKIKIFKKSIIKGKHRQSSYLRFDDESIYSNIKSITIFLSRISVRWEQLTT